MFERPSSKGSNQRPGTKPRNDAKDSLSSTNPKKKLIQVNQQRDDKLLKRIEMVKKENVIQDIDDTHLRIEDMREKIQKRDAIEAEK